MSLSLRAVRSLVFSSLAFLLSTAASAHGGDTVLCPDDKHKCEEASLIQKMTEVQLNTLIDLLMELDTIPGDLIDEINVAVTKFRQPVKPQEDPHYNDGIPAGEFYSTWDVNSIFPTADMLAVNDSAFKLSLESEANGNYFHPCQGPVTSNFGWRDKRMHNGIDLDLNKGDKVYAAFDGMVRFARFQGGFGNVVVIRHYNGLETVYAHLSKLKVKPGQVVISGQTVGLGGNTGHSTGSHLHFEVRFRGQAINPKYFIAFDEQKLRSPFVTVKKTRWGMAAYPQNVSFHIVEKGDSLFEIAKRYGTTTNKLKELNQVTGRLKKGQKIILPG